MANDCIHSQKIGGILQPADNRQLMFQRLFHLLRQTLRIPPRHRLPDHFFQRLLRRQPRQRALFGILIDQFLQRKSAALRDFETAGQRFGVAGKKPVHFFRRLHITVGMPFAPETRLVDGAIMPDTGDDILQHAPLGHMEQYVIGHHRRYTCDLSHIGQFEKPHLVIGTSSEAERHIGAIRKSSLEPPQAKRAEIIGELGEQHHDQTFAIGNEIVPCEPAFALATPLFANGQQAAKPAVCRAIHGVDKHGKIVIQIEPAADDEPDAVGACRLVGAGNARKAVAVDNAERLDAEVFGLFEKLLAGACAAQEGKMRGHLKFGITRRAHAKTPWMNQPCEPVSACSPSPERKIQKRSPLSFSTVK
ncbi:hypothetical protein D3C71_1094790 [compost metagenome]